jgi:hypothetical protein
VLLLISRERALRKHAFEGAFAAGVSAGQQVGFVNVKLASANVIVTVPGEAYWSFTSRLDPSPIVMVAAANRG